MGQMDHAMMGRLLSAEGESILGDVGVHSGDLHRRIARLRARYAPELVAAALEVTDVRRRAASKFPRCGDRIVSTREAFEQSSGEVAAEWRAARIPYGSHVLELCCGMGGDTMALARRGPVTAVDRNCDLVRCARHNVRLVDGADETLFAAADVTTLRFACDVVVLDPSRRRHGHRVLAPDRMEPPLTFARDVMAHVPNLVLKLSPLADDRWLRDEGARAEFVSVSGECRECVAWFGEIGPSADVSASVLPSGQSLSRDSAARMPEPLPIRDVVWDPDPAVVRAHLLPELCRQIGAAPLDSAEAYVSSHDVVATPFARPYRVLAVLPLNARALKRELRARGWRVECVKKRVLDVDPAEIRRSADPGEGVPVVVIASRLAGVARAVICVPCDT